MTLLAWVGAFEQQIDGIGFGAGQIPKNSMYALADFMTPEVGLTGVLCTFFIAGAALYDRRQRVEGLVFSRPLSSLRYTLGHVGMLTGGMLAILMLEYALALAIQPWLAQTVQYGYIPRVEVFWPYIQLYMVTAVPCAFFFTPVAWLLASSSRRILVAFAPLCGWWVLIYGTPGGLGANLFTYQMATDTSARAAQTSVGMVVTSQMRLGEWIDPTGLVYAREVWGQALNRSTHQQAYFLFDHGFIPLSGTFIASRLLFVVLGIVVLALAIWVQCRQSSMGI